MRILQINAVYKRLSTGSNVYEMNTIFRAQGNDCAAAYSVGQVSDPEQEYLIGALWGQKLHALLSRLLGLQGYFSPIATRRLLRKMDEFRPDVVVLNNLHANYIHLPMLLKYLAKNDIPTVAVLHDCWFYTGKCCYYTAAGCEKWKESCGNCPIIDQHNKSWFFDRTRKMHQDRIKLFNAIPRLGVVAVSDWLLGQAKQSPVFQSAVKMTRIHNWINTQQFSPMDSTSLRKKLDLQDKNVMLAVAAIWEERKGLATLISIANKLQENERLIIIGKLLCKSTLPAKVIHIPETESQTELVQYYCAADVFLQPSLEETFGKVTVEALSCGTPVVCYDSTANPELVGDGCGAVVPTGDDEGMLREARKILETGKTAYSQACRLLAQERFCIENAMKQYMILFDSLQEKQGREADALKLIQINAVCDAGSTGRICRELNDAMLQQGHQAQVLYGNGSSNYQYATSVCKKWGVKLHGLMARLLGKNAAYSPFATRKVIRFLQSEKPDIVHLHNIHGNFINIKPLLKYLGKQDIPTVITLHDCWFFTGKCIHYTQTKCNKWQTGCYGCPRLKTDIPSFFFDRTAQMWKEKNTLLREIPRLAVIGVSDWITEEGRKSPFFENAKQIRRIYNWIDLDVFYPRTGDICKQYGLATDRHKVLCIGAGWTQNSDKMKDLILMAGKLGEKYQIVLAGNVSYNGELPPNIKCVGYIQSTDELAKLYSAADVYVHLSREDTFGKVIAEAMACGTPTVVYQATACPEIVGEGCGFAVETGNVDAVVEAVNQIVQKDKVYYSSHCVENVRSRFAKDDLIRDTIRLYKELCVCDKEP